MSSLRSNARKSVIRLCRFIAEHGIPQEISHDQVLPVTNSDSTVAALYSMAVACEGMGLHVLEDRIETVELMNALNEAETPDYTHSGHVVKEVITLSSRIKSLEILTRTQEDILTDDPAKMKMVLGRLRLLPDLISTNQTIEHNTYRMSANTAESEVQCVVDKARRTKNRESGTIFDTWMTLGEGELGMILAKPGVGKTAGLVSIGAGLLTGYEGRVIHFSEELSASKVYAKYARSLGNTRRMKGELIVESHESGTSSVEFLVHRVEELMADKPDGVLLAVLVDYLGILKNITGLSRFESMNTNCVAMRAASTVFKCPWWSAVQPQRQMKQKEFNPPTAMKDMKLPVLGMDDIGECWAVAHVSDYITSLNQTEQEKECNPPRVRVHAAKIREPDEGAPSVLTIDVQADYAKSRFI